MPVPRLDSELLPHAMFLERVARQPSPTTLEARLGQGAFLALRLVDLLAPNRTPVSDDAFRYQAVATDRFSRELSAAGTEGAHVHGIVTSAADARQVGDVRLVVPALVAYAHFLEDELRLREALDVLETLLTLAGPRLASPDAVAARLRLARLNRKLNQFEAAEAAYEEAGAMAATAGDRNSELLSRIGRANTIMGRGNLPEAERLLRDVLADARTVGERDAEARAEHGVSVSLWYQGQAGEAIPHVWRAYQLYEDPDSQLRALGDIGFMFLTVGNVEAAEAALQTVVTGARSSEQVCNAMIELMHGASFRQDRLGFKRWRERCEARLEDMPPNIRTDFYLKLGIGQVRFRQFERAEASMTKSLELASAHGLHEFEFRVERILAGLKDCAQEMAREAHPATELVVQTHELREVSEALAQLVR